MSSFTRKPNRLPIPELYTKNWYFITICIQNRENIFADVAAMTPSPVAQTNQNIPWMIENIITQTWLDIPKFYNNIILDEFVVMPNHFHAIIGFVDLPKINNQITNLSNIVKSFKNITLKNIKAALNFNATGDGVIAATTVSKLIEKYKTIWQK